MTKEELLRHITSLHQTSTEEIKEYKQLIKSAPTPMDRVIIEMMKLAVTRDIRIIEVLKEIVIN
jgi:hypothetical protein